MEIIFFYSRELLLTLVPRGPGKQLSMAGSLESWRPNSAPSFHDEGTKAPWAKCLA